MLGGPSRGCSMDEDWTDLVGCEDLTREISLKQYVEHQLDECESMGADSREMLDEFVRSIEGLALPGDSWWEWVQGTERLRQMGGLAIVRNRAIVWATVTWIS